MRLAHTAPGPFEFPLIGSTVSYMRDPIGFLARCARDHGEVATFTMLGRTFYAVTKPDAIEYVLRSHAKNFGKGWRDVRLTVDPKGYRPTVQPAFLPDRMEHYAPMVVAGTEHTMRGWVEGQPLEMVHEMVGLSLQLFTETLFGLSLGEDVGPVRDAIGEINRYLAHPLRLTPFGRRLPTPARTRFRIAVKQADVVLYRMIREGRARQGGEDMLARLLDVHDEQGSPRTDKQIRGQLLKPFLAGPDTTSLLLAYTLDLIARHPEVETALVAELRDTAGDGAVVYDHLTRLPYLSCVIRETMRLYPSLWVIGREALDDCELAGYPVAAGSQVLLNMWVVHRDPRWFADPDMFSPERWRGDLGKRLPRGAYFPLGDGPHTCLGNHLAIMQSALIVANVIKGYHFDLVSARPLTLVASTTLRPRGGVNLIPRLRAGAS